AVKRRHAPHNFSRPLQLKKDPREQDGWNTWLEYLNFEDWWSEQHAVSAEARERACHAWTRLLDAARPPLADGEMELPGTKDSLHSSTTGAYSGRCDPSNSVRTG